MKTKSTKSTQTSNQNVPTVAVSYMYPGYTVENVLVRGANPLECARSIEETQRVKLNKAQLLNFALGNVAHCDGFSIKRLTPFAEKGKLTIKL